MSKTVGDRECAMLPYAGEVPDFKRGYAVRNLHCKSVVFLKKTFEAFKFYDHAMKFYSSLASYKFLPNFSYAFRVRAEEQKVWAESIIKNPSACVYGYDWLFDIDSKIFEEGHKQATILFDILKERKIPFFIMSSSGKNGGFHIRVRWENLQAAGFPWDRMIRFNYLISKNLKENYGVKDLDCSIFDLRRIARMPYSIGFGENSHWNVCLPLNEEEFRNLSPDYNEVQNVWDTIQIKFRGLQEIGSKPENAREFINDFAKE
jgi:hypothetical protein